MATIRLMATHQLEGIADWDQIWVMENGRIEVGGQAVLGRQGRNPTPWLTARHG
ncbi:hypothetical protein OUHCRE15_45630 [Enterobacter hormaechei subsp. xiangfangensis]